MGALFAFVAVATVVAPTRVKESKEEEVLYIASIRNKVITGSTGVSRTFFLTSSSCHPKIFVKEFSYFLMPCH